MNPINEQCYCCGKRAAVSIMLAGDPGERRYLPNDDIRTLKETLRDFPYPIPTYFCRKCMRRLEDAVNAALVELAKR